MDRKSYNSEDKIPSWTSSKFSIITTNNFYIGERMEHVAYRLSKQDYSIDEICKITYLVKEVVLKSIDEYSQLKK